MSMSSSAAGVSGTTTPNMAYLQTEILHLLADPMTAEVLKERIKETLRNNLQQMLCTFFLNFLLTVHLSIILVFNQLNAKKFLFYNKFIIVLYMLPALCAHHQEVKIVLYNIWYHHTLW